MSINLTRLANQYRGRKFGDLVLHHCKEQTKDQVAYAMMGTANGLRLELSELIGDWIDYESKKGADPEYWNNDCGAALEAICKEAEIYFRLFHHVQLDEEEFFSIFNITVLNYSFAAHSELSTKAFIQKSIGIGFIRRLLS